MPEILQSEKLLPELDVHMGTGTVASINQAGDFVSLLMYVEKTGNLTGLKFSTATVTVGCTLSGNVETLDPTTSIPTGTLINANATGTVVVADADDNVLKSVTFAAPVAVTAGDVIALTLRISAGTPTTLQIRTVTPTGPFTMPITYKLQSAVGAFAGTALAMIAPVYDTGVRVPAKMMLATTFTNVNLSNASTPDEVGIKITMPYSARTDRAVFKTQSGAAFKAADIVLYDDANTVLATQSLSAGAFIGTGNGIQSIPWDATVNLKKGRVYRLVFKPTTSTAWNSAYQRPNTGVTGNRRPCLDELAYFYTSRTDAGAWTDSDDSIFPLMLGIDKIYQPAGFV